MKKLYVILRRGLILLAVPVFVGWYLLYKLPSQIKPSSDHDKCIIKCHPFVVGQYDPCVCDTRYKHEKIGDKPAGKTP